MSYSIQVNISITCWLSMVYISKLLSIFVTVAAVVLKLNFESTIVSVIHFYLMTNCIYFVRNMNYKPQLSMSNIPYTIEVLKFLNLLRLSNLWYGGENRCVSSCLRANALVLHLWAQSLYSDTPWSTLLHVKHCCFYITKK